MKRFFMTVLALLLPPVAVYVKAGVRTQLYINVFFCFAFFLPAVIHAVWFVRRPANTADSSSNQFAADNDQSPSGSDNGRREPTLD